MQKNDTVKVTLLLDGKQTVNQLGKLEMEYADVRRTLKGLKKDHKDYQDLKNREKGLQEAIKKTRTELGLQGMTLQQLIRHTRDLERTRSNSTTRGTAEYKKLTAEIAKANALIQKQKMEARGMGGIWNSLGKEVKQFGVLALGYLGLTTITSQISNLIQRTGDFSDLLASVRKTTGLTQAQVEDLNASLGELDTRTARKELLEMAKVAGKLGITAQRDVEGFVRAFDKINVALGEDLGNPEEVARKLGKLLTTFKVNESFDIETVLLKVGSAINHLGKSSTANEGYIVEFARRMAGIAPLANITIQDILGMGASLDAMGQTSEVSTTALSKLFIKMASEKELFAKYARDVNGAEISTADFAKLIDTDFNEAFISLLRGVKDNSNGMSELAATLGDLEQDGGRVIGVLGTMANNIPLLYKQQQISNDEFERGTSVLDEFALMNETVGAKLDKIRKALFAAFVNTAVVKGLENMVGWMAKAAETPLDEQVEDERDSLNRLHVELLAGNTTQERRVEIINELKALYPSILSNIDAETVKNAELTEKLKAVNEQLVNRIIIERKQKEIDELNESSADRKEKLLEQEANLRQKISDIAERYGVEIPEAPDLASQAKLMQQYKNLYRSGAQGILFNPFAQLGFQIREYEASLSKMEKLNNAANDLVEERNSLMKQFFPEGEPKAQNTQDNAIAELIKKYKNGATEIEALYNADVISYESYKAAIKTMNANLDKDIAAYYDKLIEIEKLAGKDTSTLEKAKRDKQKELNVNLLPKKDPEKEEIKDYEKYIEELKKLRQELDDYLLDSDQKEIAEIERKYEALANEATDFYKKGIITEAEYQKQLKDLNALATEELDLLFADKQKKYAEDRKALQETIGTELMGEQEREIAAVTAHYDKLIAEAKKYHLDIADLEKAKAEKIDGIKNHYRKLEIENNQQAFDQILTSTAQSLNDIASIISTNSEKGIKSQQALANAAIIANQAVAMSAAIRGAAEASAAKGPLAPFVLAAYIASMLAIVTGAFAGIKSNKRQANQQLRALDEKKSEESGTNRKTYYHGGEVDDYGRSSSGDFYGKFSGYPTHKGEFVVPEYKRQDPKVIDSVAVIKARMSGYSIGVGGTNTSSTMNLDTKAFQQAVAEFQATISVLQKHGLYAKLSNRTIEDIDEHKGKKTSARDRGAL